jgi:hypothetical protein
MNQSTVGWTKDLLHLEDFGLDAIADKSRKPILGWLSGYFSMVNSGKDPQGTHADRFDENRVYSITSYSKELFLTQLMYLIGKENVMKTLKKYYSDFKFKHPTK